MNPQALSAALASALVAVPAIAQPPASQALLKNGGFEQVAAVPPGAGGQLNGWKLGSPPAIPVSWTMNPAYPGELTTVAAAAGGPGAHGGERFIRIAAVDRTAHLYQMCEGLSPARWYRVSGWVRGGAVTLSFYEYFAGAKTRGQAAAQATATGGEWRRIEGFYRPPGEGYLRSALAISVPPGQRADIDDVAIEALDLPAGPSRGGFVLETESARWSISGAGMLDEFRSKAPGGVNYAVPGTPLPVLEAVCRGVKTPLHSLEREGDRIRAQFLDPEVRATLRVSARKLHLEFEVLEAQPAGLEELELRFPVRRLATLGPAFNATYDEQFGVCLFGVTENTEQRMVPHGADVAGLTLRCTRKHGIVGARFALVAAPRGEFESAIMEAERATGLPCPLLEGKWARVSEPVRRSYLFMVDAEEGNIERIIEYAKLGHFGTIIFLKSNWLDTHGHFRVNTKSFPGGIESLQRAVAKIHAAGLGAGVHVFGPSISPNDAYITPRPDARLAGVACPPLAAAIDERATELPLSGEPPLPPKAPRSDAFPGWHIQIGEEIIRYQKLELGDKPRFTGCQRGALGTRAAAHRPGAPVKGLLSLWGYFLPDPDSTLAEELTSHFAAVLNACGFDMAYFDASDGISDAYLDRGYYLNKLHLGFYRKLKKDVLYQTSNGTGTGLVWHIVPRSASADGHGDLKRYLDERLPGMLGMEANFTRPDVGWYYMFADVRPDQIEYVCAKTMGLDGSISIETSLGTMDQHARARQMIEMVSRYERCRLARAFPQEVLAQLREPGRDFKLFGNTGNWDLRRAVYEEPRAVEALDGAQNVWTIRNDQAQPCALGVEIVRGSRNVPTGDFDQAGTIAIESFDDPAAFRWDGQARARRLFPGPDAVISAAGAAKSGVEMSLEAAMDGPRGTKRCLALPAKNSGARGGWCAVARKLPATVDLSGCEGLGLWVRGDAQGYKLRLQLHDAAGRGTSYDVPVSFAGWRLCVFRKNPGAFDWSRVDHVIAGLHDLAGGVPVRVQLDELRGLPVLHPAPPVVRPSIEVNGTTVVFPVELGSQQALTVSGPDGSRFWPGGMQPGRPVEAQAAAFVLQPGENRVRFSAGAGAGAGDFPGDLSVLLYQIRPLRP